MDPVRQLMIQRTEEKMKHIQFNQDSRVWGTWKGEKVVLVLDCLAHVDLECLLSFFHFFFSSNSCYFSCSF